MDDRTTGQYYATATGAPRQATVRWTGPESLAVEVDRDVRHWGLRDGTFTWEATPGALRLTHGKPPEVLILRGEDMLKGWAAQFERLGVKRTRAASIPWLIRIPLMLPLGFLAVCAAVYWWLLPPLAERAVVLLPTPVDTRLGDAMYAAMAPSWNMDAARSAALQRFGDRLSVAPAFTPRFHVVDDPQVNAFALPGGHIVVYTGLLDRLDAANELAALLAHEGAHVQERHSTRGIARDLSGRVFLALVIGDAAGLVTAAAGQADELVGLHYSRALESEADALALERMVTDSLDPQGVVDLLEVLQEASGEMPEGLSFLSTHPMTAERLGAAQAFVAAHPSHGRRDAVLDSLFQVLRRP